MQRRVILAFILMLLVIVLPGILFPPKKPNRATVAPPDSTAAGVLATPAPVAAPGPPPTPPTIAPSATLPAETVWVSSSLYRYGFTTRGGQLVAAVLPGYRSFAAGDSSRPVQLVPEGRPLLGHRLAVGGDTLSLAALEFAPSTTALPVAGQPATLTFTAHRGAAVITLAYTFQPDDYEFHVAGRIGGLGGTGAVLVLGLGDGLRSVDGDPVADYREFAVVTKAEKAQKKPFASLHPGERTVLDGPFEWVAVKSKYFVAVVLAPEQHQAPFAGVIAVGGERTPVAVPSLFGTRASQLATRSAVSTTLAVAADGEFRYDVYVGPFEHPRLVKLGHGLDDANPYGWSFFRPIIHPVSLVVVRVLFWMHERLHLSYGWVLIVFGILVRLALWPLNQKAMGSQLRMQAVQPLIQDIQTRYKSEPEKLQREMLKLYREHKVNPFGGCLPMMLPMPVLFALFFVFSSTIELRGVPFLWLPDLSRHDPLYIIPIVMGLSMFVVSKIGQRGIPSNPQTKTMLYFMPAMLTFVFLRLSSGLNLYYTVQNLVSIPQQYWIAERRRRDQGKK